MAADDRTEKPTAKRRQEARRKSPPPRSHDLSGAGVLIAGLIVIMTSGPSIVGSTGTLMARVFGQVAHSDTVTTTAGLTGLMNDGLDTLLATMVPVFAVCGAAAVLVNIAQAGVRPTFHVLRPKFSSLNPASGFKRIFGTQALFETGKSLAKVAVVGTVVSVALIPDLTHLGASVGTGPVALGHLIDSGVSGIVERAALGYLLIGVVDFIYQRRRYAKSLKMTKHEVKEEGKSHQLPVEVRQALRRRQLQQARARMMAAVPKADVVVTNPTHFAVALEYSGAHPAPVVVAKGVDHLALQIRRVAEEHGVPIVEDPPLARELHRVVELDQMIPAELYAAVAQVLAFVYRLAARKRVGV